MLLGYCLFPTHRLFIENISQEYRGNERIAKDMDCMSNYCEQNTFFLVLISKRFKALYLKNKTFIGKDDLISVKSLRVLNRHRFCL